MQYNSAIELKLRDNIQLNSYEHQYITSGYCYFMAYFVDFRKWDSVVL